MGLIIFLVQYCYKHCNCENCKKNDEDKEYEQYNICDPDYDALEEQKETIDGLEVYRTKYSSALIAKNLRCPLCTYHFPKEEEPELQKMIDNSYEKSILYLINSYHSLMRDIMEVDIFESLTELNNDIVKYISLSDKKRYYKHTCKRCEFQEIYIDVCLYEKGFNYKSLINKCYVYENWANNPQLKNELLKRRKEVYDEELRIRELNRIYEEKRARKNTIEGYYREDFNKVCFEKEMSYYYEAERVIDRAKYDYESKKRDWEEEERRARDEWQRERERKRDESERKRREKEENGEEINDSDYYDYDKDEFVFDKEKVVFDYKNIWEEAIRYMKYSETKRKTFDYLDNVYRDLLNERIDERDLTIEISDEEREEFVDYVYENDDEYPKVCKYLNTHSYPLYNEITKRIYIYD